MTTETPAQIKARKMTQLDTLIEALGVEQRDLSKAFYHGWILSAAMELWDRGVLTQDERQSIEARVAAIVTGDNAE